MKKQNKIDTDELYKIISDYSEERIKNPFSVKSICKFREPRLRIIEEGVYLVKMLNKYGNNNDIDGAAILLATVAHCCNDEGKYLLIKNGFIHDFTWDFEKIQNCKNKYQQKILKKSLQYFEKSVELYKEIEKDKLYPKLNDKLKFEYKNSTKVSYADIGRVYYSLNDEENFLKYAKLAISYDSLHMLSLIIKYYCDNDDYDNALYYYRLSEKLNVPYDIVNLVNTPTNESSKYNCNIWFINYLISLKKYKLAKDIIKKTKQFIVNFKTISIDNCNLALEERDRICDENIFIKDEPNKLICISKYFDENIVNLMSDDVKTYINTSILIYDYLNKSNENLDYSASLISIMKALESILYEIIANNYLKFLKRLKEIDFNKIDKCIRLKTESGYKIRDEITRIEYGSVVNIIGKRNPNDFNEWIIYDDFYNFYVGGMPNNEQAKDTLSTFLVKLDNLREKRNNVAHKEPVSRQDADYCISELIEAHINFITYIYKNFEFCFKKNNCL